MSRRGAFDRNALWLLALPTALVLLAVSFTLLLIGVLVVVVPWLVIVHEQRDKQTVEAVELLFKLAAAESRWTRHAEHCPQAVTAADLNTRPRDGFTERMVEAARAASAKRIPAQRDGDRS